MSVRNRYNGSIPPPPKSRPPPPSFAPPTLPKIQSDDNTYKRNSRQCSDLSASASSENVVAKFEEAKILVAPKLKVEETDISEVINVTLKPRRQSDSQINKVEVCKNPNNDVRDSTSQQHISNGNAAAKSLINHCQRDLQTDLDNLVEEDDLVPEIRNKCNDVNEVLNRLLNSKDEDLCGSPTSATPERKKSEPLISDPFDKVDNIADLTLDQVRLILKEEETQNTQLKTDLENQKEEHLKMSREMKLLTNQQPEKKKRKSKKEIQLEKMKNFLKDPNKDDDQDIKLDIRMKKTKEKQEEQSTEINEITNNVYLANLASIKESSLQEHSISKVLLISDSLDLRLESITCHHHSLKSEEELGPQHFTDITKHIHETVEDNKNILVTSSFGSSFSAILVVAYLTKFQNFQVADAIKQIEQARPHLTYNPRQVIKIEEWIKSNETKDKTKLEKMNSLSQTWLPMVFFSLFLFLVLRALLGCIGFERLNIFDFIKMYLFGS